MIRLKERLGTVICFPHRNTSLVDILKYFVETVGFNQTNCCFIYYNNIIFNDFASNCLYVKYEP